MGRARQPHRSLAHRTADSRRSVVGRLDARGRRRHSDRRRRAPRRAFSLSRRWRLAAFTLFVICIESGTYRVTTLVVHRDRPHVDRLESLPVDASYPVGSHSRLGRAVRRPPARARLAHRERTAREARAVVARGRHPAFRDVVANCCAACITPPTSSRECSWASARSCVTVFAARAAGAAAERRDRPQRRSGSTTMSKVAVDRPRRQDDRRRARGASRHARTIGCGRSALVGGARRASTPPSASSACSTKVPSSSSSGAATAWCNARSTGSPAAASRSRSSRPERRTSSPRASTSRRTSRRRSRSG